MIAAIYILGFILTVGITGAVWSWNSPVPLFVGFAWPAVIPIVIVHYATKQFLVVRQRRAEDRRAQQEQDARLLKEAGL